MKCDMRDSTAPEGVKRSRPVIESSDDSPEGEAALLDWAFVGNVMANDRAYWVATVDEDGAPQSRPATGVWIDDTFHVGGGPDDRWVRNLHANSSVTVHRQDAEKVVIIEGDAAGLDEDADSDRLERIDDAYEEKYGTRPGTPMFAIDPDRVLAWTEYPTDATRWTVD